MEKHAVFNSHETSWADQWDPQPSSAPYYGNNYHRKETNSSSNSKFSGKVIGDKTKAVASNGAKKVKEGARAGFHWIKDKYQKTTNKH